MLRRGEHGIEDKSQKVEDVFVGGDGRPITLEHLEDPARRGHTRPGAIFTWDEIRAAAHYNLCSASGRLLSCLLPVPIAADSSRISREDAPTKLLEGAAAAWAKLAKVRERISDALRRRTEAEDAHRRAAARGDKRAYNAAISAEMQAEEERRALEPEEVPLRQEVARAEEAIRRWCWDEHLLRSGAAERPQPVVF